MAQLCSNFYPSCPPRLIVRHNSFSSCFFLHRVNVNLNNGNCKMSTVITCSKANSRSSNGDGSIKSKLARPVAKDDKKFVHEGLITESLSNGMFRVLLDNKDLVLGYLSGKIRKNFVRVLPGDRVRVELSSYDLTKGRIVYRLRNREPSG